MESRHAFVCKELVDVLRRDPGTVVDRSRRGSVETPLVRGTDIMQPNFAAQLKADDESGQIDRAAWQALAAMQRRMVETEFWHLTRAEKDEWLVMIDAWL